jgi:hypothetical protein
MNRLRVWLSERVGELNRHLHRLRLWLAKPVMVKVRQQTAISACYVCNLCGEIRKINTDADINWIHNCKKLPKVKA